jgi:hypothetical protein
MFTATNVIAIGPTRINAVASIGNAVMQWMYRKKSAAQASEALHGDAQALPNQERTVEN